MRGGGAVLAGGCVDLGGADCRLVRLKEEHRGARRAAGAADADVWEIYSARFGPGHFEKSFDTLTGSGGTGGAQRLSMIFLQLDEPEVAVGEFDIKTVKHRSAPLQLRAASP